MHSDHTILCPNMLRHLQCGISTDIFGNKNSNCAYKKDKVDWACLFCFCWDLKEHLGLFLNSWWSVVPAEERSMFGLLIRRHLTGGDEACYRLFSGSFNQIMPDYCATIMCITCGSGVAPLNTIGEFDKRWCLSNPAPRVKNAVAFLIMLFFCLFPFTPFKILAWFRAY